MPYISSELREPYDRVLGQLKEVKVKGELEYVIFKLMVLFMKGKKPNYSNIHDCVYAAQHCADEFRRRFLDKREDKARSDNGDVVL